MNQTQQHKVESVITIGRGRYRRYEIFVDGKRVYHESTLSYGRVRYAVARRHEDAVHAYVNDPTNEVTERIHNL